VRGLQCDDRTVAALTSTQIRVRKAINMDIFPMLENWLRRTDKKETGQSCVLHAHLALLFSNVQFEQLDRGVVSTFLCAQVLVHLFLSHPVAVRFSGTAPATFCPSNLLP
jgi:hypothetical protein